METNKFELYSNIIFFGIAFIIVVAFTILNVFYREEACVKEGVIKTLETTADRGYTRIYILEDGTRFEDSKTYNNGEKVCIEKRSVWK